MTWVEYKHALDLIEATPALDSNGDPRCSWLDCKKFLPDWVDKVGRRIDPKHGTCYGDVDAIDAWVGMLCSPGLRDQRDRTRKLVNGRGW